MNANAVGQASGLSPRASSPGFARDRKFNPRTNWLTRLFASAILLAISSHVVADSPRVQLVRTPNGGIQPQAAVDERGTIHLIYFHGKPSAGDLFYVRQEPGKDDFSKPIQVNHQPGSAIAVGTIRGAQLALGRAGRVHVAWNGSRSATNHAGAPMLYARLNDASTAFEPERDLITYAAGLDGGGAIAADRSGCVYVFWHAHTPDSIVEGEAGRAVFLARSIDDGKSFARETQANPKPTGACGCCGMRALADRRGYVFALYRAASEKVNRAEVLMVSRNHGDTFEILQEHPWEIATCPMSSAWLSDDHGGPFAAWETSKEIYCSPIDPKSLRVSAPFSPPGTGKRKHPVAASNAKGERLVAWTENTGWQKGGAVAWQLYGATGQPSPEKGRADGVPVWGLVAAVARPDGRFVVLY